MPFLQSSGRGISMHIFILTAIPKWHISGYKNGHILQKMYFWSLISKMNITFVPIAWLFSGYFPQMPSFLIL